MPPNSPMSTLIAFGMTCFMAGFFLFSATLQQQTSLRLGGLLVVAVSIFSAAINARRILRAIAASKVDQDARNSS